MQWVELHFVFKGLDLNVGEHVGVGLVGAARATDWGRGTRANARGDRFDLEWPFGQSLSAIFDFER